MRLAIFTHAISETRATAMSRSQSVAPMVPTISWRSGRMSMPRSASVSGYCRARRLAMVSSSACASVGVTLALRRAMT